MANGNSESQSTRRRPTNVQAAKQTTLGKLGPAISRSALNPIANSNNATTRPSTPEPVQTDTRPSTPDPAQNTATRPSTPEQENSSARGLLPATASVSPNISTITSTPEPPIHTTGGFPTDVHGVELSSISRRNLRGVNSICMTSMADVGSFVSMNESHHPPVASIFATTSFQPAEPLSVTQTPVALRADATVEMDIYDPPNQGPPPGSSLPSPPQCYSSNPIHSEPMHSKPLAPAGSACYDMRFETPPPIINFANTNPTTLPINVYEEMNPVPPSQYRISLDGSLFHLPLQRQMPVYTPTFMKLRPHGVVRESPQNSPYFPVAIKREPTTHSPSGAPLPWFSVLPTLTLAPVPLPSLM
ncbi:hypothetical protein H0H81_007558 [Sphagnurus paluster]|uniref:Uncharacterized protein n=1 Tax=Sphagnurus paluster TaxID=117069 RepID=A0A9P7FQD2_9AGAR|nr:hypothetical protein H0H81_007558 [Sphagnurus paluster]